MSSRFDLTAKDPWREPQPKPERLWKCPHCAIGLAYVSATRAKVHIKSCAQAGLPNRVGSHLDPATQPEVTK